MLPCTIKHECEDFIVEEIPSMKLLNEGTYAYLWLEKRDYNTLNALNRVADFLKVPLRQIGFAGTKDRKAVTKQMISVKDSGNNITQKTCDNFKAEGIKIIFAGRGFDPISLGDHNGNKFIIIARNCEKKPQKIYWLFNYFDEQRFSEHNHLIGKHILKREFREACERMDEPAVREHLSERENDFVGAMKKLPLKIRQLYIHAFQSWIWNRTLDTYIKEKFHSSEIVVGQYNLGDLRFLDTREVSALEKMKIPLVGFGTEYNSNEMKKIVEDILNDEDIKEQDFIIRSMPEISAEGGARPALVEVKELEIEQLVGSNFKFSFTLQKGSYATMAIRQMFTHQ